MRKPKGAAAASAVGTIDDVIVDDNGNPISPFASDDVVDDNGNPVLAPRHPMVAAAADKPVNDPTRPPTPSMSRPPKTVGGFLANIPKSAASMLGSVGEMVLNPVDTVGGIKDAVVGGLQKMPEPGLPLDPFGVTMFNKYVADRMPDKQPVFDAFTTGMKERYGGVSEIGDTLYEDPVGAALDISGLLSLGSTAIAGRMPATARFLRTASEAIDPLRQGGRVLGGIKKGAVKGGEAIVGKTTGVGKNVVRVAEEGSPTFKQFMRGQGDHVDAINMVKDATTRMKDRMQADYRAKLADIDQSVVLDMEPVIVSMKEALSRFNVKVVVHKDPNQLKKALVRKDIDVRVPVPKSMMKQGGPIAFDLDFGRSALRHSPQEVAKVRAAFEDLASWGSRPGDLSPLGFDILKQGLDEMVAASPGRGDAIVQAVKDSVRNELNANVPGYVEMTSGYAKASQFLEEVQSALLAKNTQAAVTKVAKSLNQSTDYRKNLIDLIDTTLGTDIKGAVAGLEMQELAPRGIVGPFLAGSGGVYLLQKLGQLGANPQTLLSALAGASLFSPRLVGETLAGIATVRRSAAGQALGMAVDEGKRFVFNPATYRITEETKEQRRGKEKEIPKNWWLPDMPEAPESLMPMNTNSMLPEMPKPPNDIGAAGNSEDPIASAKEWMSKYGITMEQSAAFLPGVSNILNRGIEPLGNDAGTHLKRLLPNLMGINKEKLPIGSTREDAWRLYLGMPQKNGSFGISDFKPSIGRGETPYYFKINGFIDHYADSMYQGGGKVSPTDAVKDIVGRIDRGVMTQGDVDTGSGAMGTFKWSKGQDSKGAYISYYDKWDLAPTLKQSGGQAAGIKSISADILPGKPFEIYDRIYYDPKTFKPRTVAVGQR